MMRHTFSVNFIKAHFIFSISKIIPKVNESIQRSRSTVRMQKNVLHIPANTKYFQNIFRRTEKKTLATFPINMSRTLEKCSITLRKT